MRDKILGNFTLMQYTQMVILFFCIHHTSVDEHHEKLLAGFVSGEVPDIAIVEVGYSSLFKANPENFVDLNDFGAAELEGDFIAFHGGLVAVVTFSVVVVVFSQGCN